MADKNEGNANSEADNKDEVISKLNEQIENLNKGIATYRDEAKSAKDEATKASQAATEALTKLSEFEKLNQKKDDGITLTPEEEKKLQAYAQKHGLVSKQDLEAQRNLALAEQVKSFENQAVAEFLEKHPEYDEDDKWKEVMKEFNLFRSPTTLQGFKTLLERVHKDLSGEAEKVATAKARAEVINRSKLGIGGGSNRAGDNDAEAELDRLTKKYPHLTRDQILAQLDEVRKLPTKK